MTVGSEEVSVKYIHNSIAMVTNIPSEASFDTMRSQVMEFCHFSPQSKFTLKWIDEEQDPCVISSDMELREAIRLHHVNKEYQLTVLIFDGVPSGPGKPCPTEDLNMYRRGAKRWKKKFYLLLGHKFAARRFNRNAQCAYCQGRIWGLGQPGFKCITCRLLLHRRCRAYVQHQCGDPMHLPNYGANVSVDKVTPLNPEQPYPVVTNNGYVTPVPSDPDVHPTRPYTLDVRTSEQNESEAGRRVGIINPAFIDKRKHRSPSEPQSGLPKDRVLPILEERIAEMSVIPTVHGQVGLQDFKLLKVIGRGSYAKVFQVEHIPTRRIYAMKVIKKETILDEEDIEWVQTEKHVFECATNHPFLVGLHSCFQTENFSVDWWALGVLMFEMLAGRSPWEGIGQSANPDQNTEDYLFQRSVRFAPRPTGAGFDYAFRMPHFSVDWWALGVLMFEMLAGRSPWEGIGQSANPDQNTEDYLFQGQ
ncbi:hypothetical protein AHF37_00842 [Paragonimus kellicotti]|nr:hypothetical protein AHF37_00842 [Paragonimus kellicotti]